MRGISENSLGWVIRYRTSELLKGWWQPGILLAALIFSIPVLTIASFLLQPSGDVWQHLVDTVLTDYLINSALLTLGVGPVSYTHLTLPTKRIV